MNDLSFPLTLHNLGVVIALGLYVAMLAGVCAVLVWHFVCMMRALRRWTKQRGRKH